MPEESNIGHMRQLTNFTMDHCAAAEFIVMKSEYVDTLASTKWFTPEEFPDQTVVINLAGAKRLLSELKKSIGYIEAGIEHPTMQNRTCLGVSN